MPLPESHEALRAQSEARDDARRIAAAKVFIVLVVVAIAVYVLVPLGLGESVKPSPAHGRVCRPGPEIAAPIDAVVHMPGTVLEAHGVELPPATPCEIDVAFATNGAWAVLHETMLRCGAQTWKLAGDAAGRVGRRGALVAFAAFVDESSGAPGFEIDTEAGGALVRATGKQPFVVEIAIDRDRVVSSLAAGDLRTDAWAAAPGTHSVEWSDERKADAACYYASGPHGVEQYLGRRATVEPQRLRFWGGAELSRLSGNAGSEPFVRTFTSIEADPVVVHESLRLDPTDAAGYEGEYVYEECDRDGKGCGKCRFSAHVALRAR